MLKYRLYDIDRIIAHTVSYAVLSDAGAYDRYFAGELEDYAYPAEQVREAMKKVPAV